MLNLPPRITGEDINPANTPPPIIISSNPVVFTLNASEHADLFNLLNSNSLSPYTDHVKFSENIAHLIDHPRFPSSFKDFCSFIRQSRDNNDNLHFLLRGLPVDLDVPDFNSAYIQDPLRAKYALKDTFVGEGLLEAFARLTASPLLAYSTRNNGDFFQDVIADQRYKGTQTQKTDGELFPHNDRTAHFVRPDILNLLAMRSTGGNSVPTTFYDGRDILRSLSGATRQTLQQKIFFIPFDDFSRASNPSQQFSEPHEILSFINNDLSAPAFRFYSGRTQPVPGASHERALSALLELERAIIASNKFRVNLDRGDLLSVPNLRGLHSREIIEVVDPLALSRRWLLKTYAFWSDQQREQHRQHFDPTTPGRVID